MNETHPIRELVLSEKQRKEKRRRTGCSPSFFFFSDVRLGENWASGDLRIPAPGYAHQGQ
jgi:hypothetical protein